jgi:hypothetical protein
MTELEKQIITYLPFKIKVKILNHKSDYVGIEYSTLNGFYFLNGKVHFTYEGGSTGKSTTEIKLILNPLSDFYEDVDGVSFSDMISAGYHSEFWYAENFDIRYLLHHDYIKLLSKHADLFGLIEKGLATDIKQTL